MNATSSARSHGHGLQFLATNHPLREILLQLQVPFRLDEGDEANNMVRLCALYLEQHRPREMGRGTQTQPLLPVLFGAIKSGFVVRSDRCVQLSSKGMLLLDSADIIRCGCGASRVRWKFPESAYCYNCGGLM